MALTSMYEVNLRYTRNDITSSETSERGCLRVLPQGKKSRQKVAMGDKTGAASVFAVGKHHEIKVDFKTQPEGQGIGAVELFGDQVFIGSGSRVSAYTKKGKPFFALETNMSETLATLKIDTPYLHIGGSYVMNRFKESTDQGYYMSPDRINAMLAKRLPGANPEQDMDHDMYLGCQDRVVRTVRTTQLGNKAAEAPTEGPVQSMCLMDRTDQKNAQELTYGTTSGSIGGFSVGSKNELIRKFTQIPESKIGGVFAIAGFDITKDGFCDIAVGRDDGIIELYSFNKNPDGTPVSIWKGDVGECVNTVEIGCVTNSAREELVLHTYTGKILSYTVCEEDAKAQAVVPSALQGPQAVASDPKTEALSQPIAPPPIAQYDTEVAPKVEILQKKEVETTMEIQRMRDILKAKKAEFANLGAKGQLSQDQANKAAAMNMRAVSSNFTVRSKEELEETAVLAIHLEVDVPLDTVGIQSDLNLELVDYGDSASNAMITLTKNHPGKSQLCAIARCAEGQNRKVVLRFRTVEGQAGTVRCFVMPNQSPRSAQLKEFSIRPLSLHQRAQFEASELPLSSVKLTGSFSVKDAHAWVYQCIPDVAAKFAGGSDGQGELQFRNAFSGTSLVVKYKKGEAEFQSENMSTLVVLKDFFIAEASNRKIAVKIASDVHADSVHRCIELLHPLIEYQFGLVYKQSVVDALREVESQEQTNSFLSNDYKDILANAGSIDVEAKRQPKRAEYLRELAIKLLHDTANFKGDTVPPAKLQHVKQLLTDQYDGRVFMDVFTA